MSGHISRSLQSWRFVWGPALWLATLTITLPLLLDSISFAQLHEGKFKFAGKLFMIAPIALIFYGVTKHWVLAGLSNEHWKKKSSHQEINLFDGPLLTASIAFAGSLVLAWLISIYTFGGFLLVILNATTAASICLLPFGALFFFRTQDVPEDIIFRLVFLSLILFLMTNFALAGLGVFGEMSRSQVQEGALNMTAALIGLSIPRISFPWTSGGLNGFGVAAVLTFTIGYSALWFSESKKMKLLGLWGMGLSVLAVIAVDSRTAIASILLSSLSVPLLGRSKGIQRIFPFGLMALISLPLIILLIAPALQNTHLFTLINRGGYSDPAAAMTTGRSYIWHYVYETVAAEPSKYIFGVGQMGHVVTNLASKYAFVFPGELGLNTHTTHNTVMQTIIDRGLVGALLLLFLIFRSAKLITQKLGTHLPSRHWAFVASAACLTNIVLFGQTEAAATPYFQLSMYVFFVCVACAAYKNSTQQSRA